MEKKYTFESIFLWEAYAPNSTRGWRRARADCVAVFAREAPGWLAGWRAEPKGASDGGAPARRRSPVSEKACTMGR